MASQGWIWDPTRNKWYQIDYTNRCYVYQDGARIAIPTSPQAIPGSQSTHSGKSIRTKTGSTASGSSVEEGSSSSSATKLMEQLQTMSLGENRSNQSSGVIRNKKHNITQDPTGRETSLDPDLFRQGVRAVVRVGQPHDRQYETLDPKFKRRHRSFYCRGKVFRILWPEPAGNAEQGSVYSSGAFNEKYHMKIRWFVVIREGATFCSCLPIATYSLQGVGKPRTVKEEHSVIYTGDKEPAILSTEFPTYGEREMRPSIRVRPRSRGEKLDAISRLNYAKVYTVEHNVKVYEFGDVHKDSMKQLVKNFKAVWKMDVSTSDVTEPIIWEEREEHQDDEEEDEEEEDEDEDEDEGEDDNMADPRRGKQKVNTGTKHKEMNAVEMATHNYYLGHYVTAYRNNGLHKLADSLQHATIAQQQAHIKQAQEEARKILPKGNGQE